MILQIIRRSLVNIIIEPNKKLLPAKLFGVYEHKVSNRKVPLVRGFDDIFLAPHSRHTETPAEAVHACKELNDK